MAFDIIYKGQLTGTQVDFQTGNLTDISTFDTDVRASAIENQIVDGITDRGASQDAIHAMSGYLAANAHPSVTPASDVTIDLSDGNVIQDLTLLFDGSGHVTGSSSDTINLDNRYYKQAQVTGISGALQSQITSNDTDISNLGTDITTLSGLITGNDADITTLSGLITGNDADITTLSGLITGNDADITTLSGLITGNDADIVTLSGLITGNDADITTLSGLITGNDADITTLSGLITGNDNDITNLGTDINTLSGLITGNDGDISGLQAVSGNYQSLNLQDVTSVGAITDKEIIVSGLDLSGDGTSATISGPSTIVLDPSPVGSTGTVVVQGDLDVRGTTTTVHSTEVNIGDINLVLGTGSQNDEAMDDGGLILSGTHGTVASFLYNQSSDEWASDLPISATTFRGALAGNATTATSAGKWTNARTISLTGDVSGSASIDGSADASIDVTLASIGNDLIQNSSITVTAGSGLANGGEIALGGTGTLDVGAGNGISVAANSVAVNYDNSTIGLNGSSKLAVKAGGIASGNIGSDAIGPIHLHQDVAGDNITFADGVLSVADADIQAGITGAASTITANNLTASRALASNTNGKVVVATTTLTELNHLTGVSSSVQDQLNGKVSTGTSVTGDFGISGGGDLSASRGLSTTSDQGHLDEVEYGSDDSSITNIVTKGGVLVLRGKNVNGITTDGTDGEAINLEVQTTVAFEGVVQSMDSTNADGDGETVAMWKIQGVLQRNDADVSMLSSYVTNTYRGSSAANYDINVSVDNSGLNIASDQASDDIITSATLNYNWIQYTA